MRYPIVHYTGVLITAIKGFIVKALMGQVLNSNLDFLFFKKHFREKICVDKLEG
jgi:hypothetical protein